jgi:hypothetical protein
MEETRVRAIITAGLLVASGSTALAAQRAHGFDLGVFGAYTHYDQAFNLDYGMGGGARLTYFLTNHIGLGADVLFQREQDVPGSPGATMDPLVGGVNLVVRLPALLHVVAGYSRLDFGKSAPYSFTDGGVHGGLGIQLPIGGNVGVWLEGRAIHSPKTNLAGQQRARTSLA